MNDTAEKLLSEAEQGEEGRRASFALRNEAKALAEAAVFLGMSLHKWAADDSVSCAEMAFDQPLEVFVFRALHSAQTEVAACREKVTAAYIAQLKDRGRV